MNIKVGDKVRIKTEEELLAGGWKPIYSTRNSVVFYSKLVHGVWGSQCGTIIEVTEVECGYVLYSAGLICIDAIAEIVQPTLDEYICNLPLEERAKYFVYRSEFDWYSTLIGKDAHFVFEEEAIQATVEALKQPKE